MQTRRIAGSPNSLTVGNQQPSPAPVLFRIIFRLKLELGRFRDYPKGVARLTIEAKHLASNLPVAKDDDIVHPLRKLWDKV